MASFSNRAFLCCLLAAGATTSLSGAEAGDRDSLPRRNTDCASYGAGFVAIQGTQTCVRVGGHVRVEMEGGRPVDFDRASHLDTPRADLGYSLVNQSENAGGTFPAALGFSSSGAR